MSGAVQVFSQGSTSLQQQQRQQQQQAIRHLIVLKSTMSPKTQHPHSITLPLLLLLVLLLLPFSLAAVAAPAVADKTKTPIRAQPGLSWAMHTNGLDATAAASVAVGLAGALAQAGRQPGCCCWFPFATTLRRL